MKKALVLFLAVLGVLCFSSVALAEGFTVSADYRSLTSTWEVEGEGESEQDLTSLTIGGEYEAGSFLVGGSYLFVLSYDPAPEPGTELSDNFLWLYGGYKILDEETYSLALVGGYSLWTEKYTDSSGTLKAKVSSIGVGAKGMANLGPINLSALLLYGVSNEYKIESDGIGLSGDDVSAIHFELKGSYQFTDALGAFAVYRCAAYSIEILDSTTDITISGFGLGVEYRF